MNKKEAILALLDGKVLVDHGGSEISFDEQACKPFGFSVIEGAKKEPLNDQWAYIEGYKIKEEWYKNIPECGVLCWVWDKNRSNRVSIVDSYISSNEYHFYSGTAFWKNAVPLTKEEALGMVL